jgi:lipocalin
MTNMTMEVNGTATVASATVPNRLVVQFPFKIANYPVYTSTGDYTVLATDYTSYALVYSCRQVIPYIVRTDSMWALSRAKTLSPSIISTLDSQASALGVKISNYETVQQTCSN